MIEDIVKQYEILIGELEKYNPELLDKERILKISKSDMLDEELKEEIAIGLPKDLSSLFISSVTPTRNNRDERFNLEKT